MFRFLIFGKEKHESDERRVRLKVDNFVFTFERSAKIILEWFGFDCVKRVRWNRWTSNEYEAQSLFLKQTIECSFLWIIEASFLSSLKLHHVHEMNFTLITFFDVWLWRNGKNKKFFFFDLKSNQGKKLFEAFFSTPQMLFIAVSSEMS